MAETPDATTVPSGPFTGPALWYGPEVADRDDWVLTLSAGHREELRTAVRTVRRRAAPLLRMTVADFPLPTLAVALGRAAAALTRGRGFVLLRSVPPDLLGEAEASTVLRGIGQYLGRPVPQTPDGRTLCHVRDAGATPGGAAPPAYRTRAAIPFHTAESDLLGLLCLRPARSGGRTLLASAAAVHNAVLDARPDLAGHLYRSHHFDRDRDRTPDGETPLSSPLVTRHGDRPSMRYDRGRLAHGPRDTQDVDRELYALIDTTAASPHVRLDLDLGPGDLLLLDNHAVLHARSAYDDFDAPQDRRHLLRLWLARPEDTAPGEQGAAPPVRPPTRAGVVPRDVVRPRGPGVARPGCGCQPPRAPRGWRS
ncbi:TauD/TfdA family dioxygenase [Streptomyces sp. NPDC058739]|uniref:TauD/TfdA family dioxygenase n=1 Tax=Streptomyces sp. NPDC058739 TaxID=3346618 RepID=UPI00367FA478